jgi:hypothetical protein
MGVVVTRDTELFARLHEWLRRVKFSLKVLDLLNDLSWNFKAL